ncbi:MAG: hypothetical protein PV354_04675, partial [Bartonella sp.]|nr:hypothetical protein [Bartonella sp.]
MNTHLTNEVKKFEENITNITQAVQGDALLWDKDKGAFVAQHGEEKGSSRITSLQAGKIAADSTDAVNGSQLYSLGSEVAKYFGGGAGYKDGKWTAPTFKIAHFNVDGSGGNEKSYSNVASAFAGVNGGMSILNDRIKKLEKQGGQGGSDSDSLKWNEEKDAYDANREGKDSKITGVANGKVEKDSKEAVNGGQLWDTNERVTNVENKVDHMSNTINGIAENTVQYDKDVNGKKINKITLAGGDAG